MCLDNSANNHLKVGFCGKFTVKGKPHKWTICQGRMGPSLLIFILFCQLWELLIRTYVSPMAAQCDYGELISNYSIMDICFGIWKFQDLGQTKWMEGNVCECQLNSITSPLRIFFVFANSFFPPSKQKEEIWKWMVTIWKAQNKKLSNDE